MHVKMVLLPYFGTWSETNDPCALVGQEVGMKLIEEANKETEEVALLSVIATLALGSSAFFSCTKQP